MGATTAAASKKQKKVKCAIFISHAHKDIRLVMQFVALLKNGAGVNDTQYYASSLEETKKRNASDKHEALSESLTKSRIHIALITPNYLRSADCNAELGYMWANRKRKINNNNAYFFPFCYKLLQDPSNFPWYLRDTTTYNLETKEHLKLLKDSIEEVCVDRSDTTPGSWAKNLKIFASKLTNLVADVPESVDYDSMGRFIDACESFHRVLFFNVQVSLDDWFRPEMQTHLAMQDAITTNGQLAKVIDVDSLENATKIVLRSEFPDYYGTPTARVCFVKLERKKLVAKLKRGDRDVQNFIDIALMHLFMSTPLAIVTLDQLDTIMKYSPDKSKSDDMDFTARKERHYTRILKLPSFKEMEADESERLSIIGSKLDSMIMRPGIDTNTGIDFALLMNNRLPNRKQAYEIWTGGMTEAKDMQYTKVNNCKKNSMLYRFGKRIEHTVFRTLSKEDVDAAPLLNKILDDGEETSINFHKFARSLIARRNPCFKVFHDASNNPKLRSSFARAMKLVNPAYCPLHILSEAAGGKTRSFFDLSNKE